MTGKRRREGLALVMAHENEVVLPTHVRENRPNPLEGGGMGKVLEPEGKERWNAEAGALLREELEMEHEHCKGDDSVHMEKLL